MVWIFLADYQRWYDYFLYSDVATLCDEREIDVRKPAEGDLFLACSDALIAAQNAVVAAESFGLGSCYIGDIMENYETHRDLFKLPPYVFPIAMLVFGYPTEQQKERKMTTRFDKKFIVFENQYQRLSGDDFDEMFAERNQRLPQGKAMRNITNFGQYLFLRKFNSAFSREMNRSVKEMVKVWREG